MNNGKANSQDADFKAAIEDVKSIVCIEEGLPAPV